MWDPRTLLITDHNLGDKAYRRMAKDCGNLEWVMWNRAGNDEAEVVEKIAHGDWELAVSFYSDLIIPPPALRSIRLPLNIHPALPSIRGVGYDVLPLIEGHRTVGATLHHMESRIDSGKIYHVIETSLSPDEKYSSLRKKNQFMCLELLDFLCGLLAVSTDVDQLLKTLAGYSRQTNWKWGATYYSRKMIGDVMDEIREFSPNHPCLL